MSKLPIVSGEKVVKALMKAGFAIVGRRGSHIRLKRRVDDEVFIVIVPLHKELKRGTLASIIRQSGIPREEFIQLLKR